MFPFPLLCPVTSQGLYFFKDEDFSPEDSRALRPEASSYGATGQNRGRILREEVAEGANFLVSGWNQYANLWMRYIFRTCDAQASPLTKHPWAGGGSDVRYPEGFDPRH